MTWGWSARGELPIDANATGTTGGGSKGGVADAGQTKAWPRYEAEYLKRALASEHNKYDTSGLDETQRKVYLDHVVTKYKEEADEILKHEFDQWLEGRHAANVADEEYVNAEGKPVRRWMMRSKEAEDLDGGSKVGQARAGWKHTPWGRSSLTGLPGVREYLRGQKEHAVDQDLRLQMLGEFGPQNIDEAWMYFKHWVKGRPLSDAVNIVSPDLQQSFGTRSDFGHMLPQRMYEYKPDPRDRQPEVQADDPNAYNAARALPAEGRVRTTTDVEDKQVLEWRQFRETLEGLVGRAPTKFDEHEAEVAEDARDSAARRDDAIIEHELDREEMHLERQQEDTRAVLTGPATKLLPAF